mgnify:CR=1 FL=1
MKVPEYRSQTPLSTNRGAQMLSVQANPSALAQSAVAAQNFGAELSRQSLSIMEQLVGEKRKTELNNAEVMLGEQLASLQLDVEQENPSTVMGDGPRSFKSRANQLASKIALDLDDSVVRKRFKNNSNLTVANNSIRVNANAQKRIYDAAYASEIELAETYKRTIALGPGASSATEVNEAKLKLYGVNAQGIKVQQSLYENMASRNLISQSDAVKLEIGSREDIQTQEVRGKILTAKAANNEQVLENLVQALMEGKYENLSASKSLDLASQALSLAIAIDNEKEANEKAAASASEKQKKDDIKQNERNLLASVINWKNGGEKPSLTTVDQQLQNGEINPSIANTVLSHLTEEVEVVEDRGKTIRLLDEARSAVTQEKIDEVKEEALSLAEDMSLELSTLETVLRVLDTSEDALRTNQSKKNQRDLTVYKGFLNQRFGFDEAGVKLSGIVLEKDTNRQERYFDAAQTYYELASSGEMSPKEAFELVLEQIETSQARNLSYLGLSEEFMNTYFPTVGNNPNFNFALTPQLIMQAKEALDQNNNITQVQKMLDLETIDLLYEEYLATINTDQP